MPMPTTRRPASQYRSRTRARVISIAPLRSAAVASGDQRCASALAQAVHAPHAVPGIEEPVLHLPMQPVRLLEPVERRSDGPRVAATRCGAARPCALTSISAANSSGESATPAAACARVPAAGTRPDDRAVEPAGTASRSRATQSTPAPASRTAAVRDRTRLRRRSRPPHAVRRFVAVGGEDAGIVGHREGAARGWRGDLRGQSQPDEVSAPMVGFRNAGAPIVRTCLTPRPCERCGSRATAVPAFFGPSRGPPQWGASRGAAKAIEPRHDEAAANGACARGHHPSPRPLHGWRYAGPHAAALRAGGSACGRRPDSRSRRGLPTASGLDGTPVGVPCARPRTGPEHAHPGRLPSRLGTHSSRRCVRNGRSGLRRPRKIPPARLANHLPVLADQHAARRKVASTRADIGRPSNGV